MNRKAGHTAVPLLGSRRQGKSFRDFLEDVPVEILNKQFIRSWSMDPWFDTFETASGSDFSMNGLGWGKGSGTNEPVTPIMTAGTDLQQLTNAADNDEVLASGPEIFTVQAGRPITFMWEGEVNSVNVHGFIGLANTTSTFDTAQCLVASTGAIGTVDMIGLHWTASAATNLQFRQSAVSEANSMTLAIPASTRFRFAMIVGNPTAFDCRAYLSVAGDDRIIDRQFSTAGVFAATMAPTYCFQNHTAGAKTITYGRFFACQEYRSTANFLRWLS